MENSESKRIRKMTETWRKRKPEGVEKMMDTEDVLNEAEMERDDQAKEREEVLYMA